MEDIEGKEVGRGWEVGVAMGYFRPITVIFCLWAKYIPWLQSAHLWPVNTLGRFHSVIKYGQLTTARYGRPMNERFQL